MGFLPIGRGSAPETVRTVEDLEAERGFLLRSIADLEVEFEAGELTAPRYHQLHDRYTVEAAIVLRALEHLHTQQGIASSTVTASRPRRWRLLMAPAVVVALVASGALLRGALAERAPGGTITGNAQSGPPDLAALARAVETRPTDPQAHLDYGWALLQSDRPVDALRTFDQAATLDPSNPAPKAYAGWIVFLAGLPDQALPRLDEAIAADPSYPDAHFFRGMVLLRGRGDEVGALAELREYRRLQPSGPEQATVETVIAELERSLAPTTAAGS